MQTTGDLIGVVVELSAGVQHRHDDLGRGDALLGMDPDRDTATVITYADRVVGVDNHPNFTAISGQGLVDGVVHHLEDHMVQARAVISIADVHAGSLADRI